MILLFPSLTFIMDKIKVKESLSVSKKQFLNTFIFYIIYPHFHSVTQLSVKFDKSYIISIFP